jgi:hypothetical protein
MSQIDKEDASRTIFGVGQNDGANYLFLTTNQQTAISETLLLTDELDAIYDQNGGVHNYANAFDQVNEKYESIKSILPSEDIRTLLLAATMESYLHLGSLLLSAERNQLIGDPSAMTLVARMRKAFIRKIMTGDLDSDGQSALNYLLGK